MPNDQVNAITTRMTHDQRLVEEARESLTTTLQIALERLEMSIKDRATLLAIIAENSSERRNRTEEGESNTDDEFPPRMRDRFNGN